MFVKLVSKKGAEGCYVVSLFECSEAHIKPQPITGDSPRGSMVITLNPHGPELNISYDEHGKPEADVYFLNNDGQTIDKVA